MADLLTSLEHDGFVLIPSVLSKHELQTLRTACSEAVTLARAGKWSHIRTLPKQFPPWPSDPSHGIWGVQHLLHPALPNSKALTASYFSDAIVSPVKELLSATDDELVMELYNLLVRPDQDFALRWHRDDIPPTATVEEELKRLNEPAWHAQWNLALYDDRSLVVVPESHRRARTEAERNADPYESNMLGQKIVEIKAGDVMFYDNNILHRGVYDATVERMTLHGSIGHVKGSSARAQNVLQHGVGAWVDECRFDDLPEGLKNRANGMRARLHQMGSDNPNVGYSQDD
ncbi:phytanoyl-CoA dioxygenase [Eremomyces bilateralis CBS 781.70]|uniref:Phytanoyl-CoA dioxygenase n=1 Tax=Eremomyces bilateralis CBS 781.70 TaxID=1392243 RepID=A0A6G1FU91_9PEZI|nr:phytanoyl-CoA dioxygenase [Eremomyces bilateralis CBS 781.70]KAF1809276.1 phytanoyl-CoA dioxygenase [Eremomyces bilateralis CBS 781.70]